MFGLWARVRSALDAGPRRQRAAAPTCGPRRYAAAVLPCALRSSPSLAAAAALTAALALAGCGAGPRESSSTTIDTIVLDRGVVVGEGRDRAPGVRAISAKVPKTLDSVQPDVTGTLFGDGGETITTPYLNGVHPVTEGKERVYPGDRAAYLVRDESDPGAAPDAIVGLYPAPFTTRFTYKRRLKPTRLQCADTQSRACRAIRDTFLEDGITAGRTNLQDSSSIDVLRVYVGPWQAIRPALDSGRMATASDVEQPAERNGYGFQIDPATMTVRAAAPFGEATGGQSYGPGTGFIYAVRDSLGAPAWIVSGVDENGVNAAAGAIDEATLLGRVAAVIPPR